jgi:hypothetical protein
MVYNYEYPISNMRDAYNAEIERFRVLDDYQQYMAVCKGYEAYPRKGKIVLVDQPEWTHPAYAPSGTTLTVGCKMRPTGVVWAYDNATPPQKMKAKITIYDSFDPNWKRIYDQVVPNDDGTVTVIWDKKVDWYGLVRPILGPDYYMKVEVKLAQHYIVPFSGPVHEPATFTFDEPAVAIRINGGFPVEMETDTSFTFDHIQHNTTVSNETWDFYRRAYKNQPEATDFVYQPSQELSPLTGFSSGNAKFPSGSKAINSPASTPLGLRKYRLSYTDGNQQAQTTPDHRVNLVVGSARITFYYDVYEYRCRNTSDPAATQMEDATVGTGANAHTYSFAKVFLQDVRREGWGRIYRIRANSGMGFSEGEEPENENSYLGYSNNTFTFSAASLGSRDNPLKSQTAARLEYDFRPTGFPENDRDFRSVYNYGSHVAVGLKEAVNARIQYCVDHDIADRPKIFTSDILDVQDKGSFNIFSNSSVIPDPDTGAVIIAQGRNAEERHLDVFLEGESDEGISQDALDQMMHSSTSGKKIMKVEAE